MTWNSWSSLRNEATSLLFRIVPGLSHCPRLPWPTTRRPTVATSPARGSPPEPLRGQQVLRGGACAAGRELRPAAGRGARPPGRKRGGQEHAGADRDRRPPPRRGGG